MGPAWAEDAGAGAATAARGPSSPEEARAVSISISIIIIIIIIISSSIIIIIIVIVIIINIIIIIIIIIVYTIGGAALSMTGGASWSVETPLEPVRLSSNKVGASENVASQQTWKGGRSLEAWLEQALKCMGWISHPEREFPTCRDSGLSVPQTLGAV